MDSELNNNKRQKLQFWVFLIGLFIISLILGIIGFERYYTYHSLPHNLLKSFYNALQLFVLESGDQTGYLPLELNIARFVAPLVSLIAITLTLLQIFRGQWERFKISMMRDHAVIVGFGTLGKNILNDLVKKRKKILVIDSDLDTNEKVVLQNAKCRLMNGNATEKDVLRKARIEYADIVYLLTDNDTTQIKTCLELYQLVKESKRKKENPLNCIMHLHKQELMSTLKNHKLVQNIKDAFTLIVFNMHESSARDLFEEFPPDRNGISIDSNTVVQILIFGFGPAGEALAIQTALTGHYLNGKSPKIVIIDSRAEDRISDFLDRYPTFSEYCEIESITIESDNPQILNKVLPYTNIHDSLTTFVLCYESKTRNLLLGLQFDNVDFNEHVHIFIRTSDDFTFNTFSQKVRPYGLASKVCSHEAICSEFLDKKAIAFHHNYLEKRRKEDDFGKKDADVPWEELSQEYKDSNRKAADHIGVKMRAIACEIVEADDPRPEAKLTQEELIMLAKHEHKRWNAERSLAGWTYSKTRNDKARETPDLTDWEKLSKETQEYDIDAVKSILDVLASVGLKAVRL